MDARYLTLQGLDSFAYGMAKLHPRRIAPTSFIPLNTPPPHIVPLLWSCYAEARHHFLTAKLILEVVDDNCKSGTMCRFCISALWWYPIHWIKGPEFGNYRVCTVPRMTEFNSHVDVPSRCNWFSSSSTDSFSRLTFHKNNSHQCNPKCAP